MSEAATVRAMATPAGLAMFDRLVRNALYRTFRRAGHGTGQRLHVLSCALRVVHPFAVELERTSGHAERAFTRIDLPRVTTVQQLVQVVVRLHVLAGIADQADRQFSIVDPHFLGTAFAERTAVKADDRRAAEVRINTIESRGIRNC